MVTVFLNGMPSIFTPFTLLVLQDVLKTIDFCSVGRTRNIVYIMMSS